MQWGPGPILIVLNEWLFNPLQYTVVIRGGLAIGDTGETFRGVTLWGAAGAIAPEPVGLGP